MYVAAPEDMVPVHRQPSALWGAAQNLLATEKLTYSGRGKKLRRQLQTDTVKIVETEFHKGYRCAASGL